MPELTACLTNPELKLSKKDKSEMLALREKYADLNPKEADRKTLIDYHKSLFDGLNNLKDAVGVDADTYTPFDNSEQVAQINKRFDDDLVKEDSRARKENEIKRLQKEKADKAAKEVEAEKTFRESAARLKEEGDIEGAKKLEQRAAELEDSRTASKEAKENHLKTIERLEKKQAEKGLSEKEEKKLDTQKTRVAVIQKFGKTQEELIQELKDKGLLKQHCE